MLIDELLRPVLGSCAWVKNRDLALRLVPELASDLPQAVDMPTAGGTVRKGIPLTAAAEIIVPTGRVATNLARRALDGEPREATNKAEIAELLADPLVPMLAQMMAECSMPGLRTHALPGLAVAWAASNTLTGRWDLLKALNDVVADAAEDVAHGLNELPPARRGVLLADVAWGLNARVAAAYSLARTGDRPVQPSGLVGRMFENPLVMAFPRGTLDRNPSFGIMAAMLDLPLKESLIVDVDKAAGAAVAAVKERLAKGTPTTADETLMSLLPTNEVPTHHAVLLDPAAGPFLVGALPDITDKGALKKAGVSSEIADGLTRRDTAQAVASSWRDLVYALLTWDLLSSIGGLFVPLRQSGGNWIDPYNVNLGPDPRWSLALPRPKEPPVTVTVVAMRLAHLRDFARSEAERQKKPTLDGAASGAWLRLVDTEEGAACAFQADHGLAIFGDPLRAMRFAREAVESMSGPGRLNAGPVGDSLQIPERVKVSAGVATGQIEGGWDGLNTFLEGAAVREAMELSGGGSPPDSIPDDPLTLRRAYGSPAGLRSRTAIFSGSAARAIRAEIAKTGAPLHSRGHGGRAGGVDEDFEYYPFQAWWEDSNRVIGLLDLDPSNPGICEPVEVEMARFRQIFDMDGKVAWDRRQMHRGAAFAPAADTSPQPATKKKKKQSLTAQPPPEPVRRPPIAEPEDSLEQPPDETEDLFGQTQGTDPFAGLGVSEGKPSAPSSPSLDRYSSSDTIPPGQTTDPFASSDWNSSASAGSFDDAFSTGPGSAWAPPPAAEEEAVWADNKEQFQEMTGAGRTHDVDDDADGMSIGVVGPPMMTDDSLSHSPLQSGQDLDGGDLDWSSSFDDPASGQPSWAEAENESTSFSLVDPYADPGGSTGGRDPWDEDPFGAAQTPAVDPGGYSTGATDPLAALDNAPDLTYALHGYVVHTSASGVFTFGRRYGQTLLDAHSYQTGGHAESAYRAFVQDKAKEGFVPQPDKSVPMPQGGHLEDLDTGLLAHISQRGS